MNQTHTTEDPLSVRYELAAAFAAHADDPSPAAALAVAVALGQARLFGVDLSPELDGRLTPALAAAAVAGLEAERPTWVEAVQKLDAGYGGEWRTDGDEDCVRLLEHRVRAWGAAVAVREAADAHPELRALAERAAAVGAAFDRWLRGQEEELCAVAGLPLLATWKALLAPPHSDPLPWWLDGTLEASAARVRQAALAALPSEAAWRLVASKALLPPPGPECAGKAGHPAAESFEVRVLRWASPDGRRTARLNLPEAPTAADEERPRAVNFAAAAGAAVPPGTPVRLGRAAAVLGEDGRFRVSLAQLRGADLRLDVGGEWWLLTDATPSGVEERR